jgi:hypothetical protein
MNVVRLREIIVCIMAACSVYACATGSTSPPGGEGGEGGDGWGGPTSGPSSSASGSSGSSSGSSGSTVCDTKSTNCQDCVTCSRESADGICVDVFNDCLADQNCVDFATCISGCADGDTLCTSGCEDSYPTGVPIFDVYASCVICQDCAINCDAANACM